MSSEIFYKKAFIKVGEDQYLPMIQTGSTNCFEVNPITGRGLAEKTWWIYNYPNKSKFIFSEKEIIACAKSLEISACESGGGYRKTRNTPFKKGEMERWLIAGIKKAKTIEEYTSYGNCFVCTLNRFDRDKWKQIEIKTTGEFFDVINNIDTIYKNNDPSFSFKNNRELFLPKHVPVYSHFFILKDDHDVFVEKITKRHFLVTNNIADARKFDTKRKAELFIEKHSHLLCDFKIIEQNMF